jgi:predicted AlkP superfamily pyrophosphatase or phosphodiesterase
MRFKISILLLCILSIIRNAEAQKKIEIKKEIDCPKIVVGLVIDQMRWDYLYRYYNRYSETGFKRLLNKGYNFENTFIPYVPTYTAVGHSCVYTGGIPATTGIVGNNWYEKSINRNMYCTQDSTAKGIGNNNEDGKMSPRNLWATTIGDELKLSNASKSKVIGIALKDRGAILTAGHAANAAYWFDEKTGKWITSDYYMNALPSWVSDFNAKDLAANYLKKDWETIYPIETYTQSTSDDKEYENNLIGFKTNVFPYKLSTLNADKYSTFKFTPHAASFTFDFAKSTIEQEKMGAGAYTDMVTISISSTDYTGHAFGPNSIEIEDTYLRLDKDLSTFLEYLDKKFGSNNYLFFITADHGVSHVPGFLKENKIPTGIMSESELMKELNKQIEDSFAVKKAIYIIQNYQVYIDNTGIRAQGKNEESIKQFIIEKIAQKPYVTNIIETAKLGSATIAEPMKSMLINGYTPSRSGDIQFVIKPGYFDGGKKGTTHGSWNPYDAHIPLIFLGWHVKQGSTNKEVYMTDIAPTLAAMLHIQMPSGNVGKVLEEVIK